MPRRLLELRPFEPDKLKRARPLPAPMGFAWETPPRIVGHRGNPAEADENTLASFRAARDAGVGAVELDVRMTRDGVLVVHHDAELGRVAAGEGLVEELRADALPPLVPTLRDVLLALPGMLVDAEIKPDAANAEDVPAALAELVVELGARERILATSFAPELADAYAAALDVPAGAILPFAPEPEDLAAWPRLAWVMLAQDAALPEVLANLRANRRRVGVWTVNDEKDADALLAAGADCVITDRPRALGRRR